MEVLISALTIPPAYWMGGVVLLLLLTVGLLYLNDLLTWNKGICPVCEIGVWKKREHNKHHYCTYCGETHTFHHIFDIANE